MSAPLISSFAKKHGIQYDSNMDITRLFKDMDRELTIYRSPSKVWVFVGVLAAVISLAAIIFQIVQIVETQSAEDISYVYLAGLLIVQILWALYAAAHQVWVSLTSAILGSITIAVIIGLKGHYDGIDGVSDE